MNMLALSLLLFSFFIAICASFQQKPQFNSFLKRYDSAQTSTNRIFPKSNLSAASSTPNFDSNLSTSADTSNQKRFKISTKTYEYDGWTLSYKHKEWDPNYSIEHKEIPPSLLLIHPVGIGLSNWFWDRVFDLWEGEVYAPNLIGCARDGLGDTWDPKTRGLFLPLDWARSCETLIREEIIEKNIEKEQKRCIVVTQGGLAPVGVVLAHRDAAQKIDNIQGLVLTSPPTWKDMIGFVPQDELEKNYKFLSSPILGDLAFRILEMRGAIQFFSDLFLFQDKCDEEWLNKATFDSTDNNAVTSKLLRPPVMSFNAGMLNARSFMQEMIEISQPTLILSGEGDKRAKDRIGYAQEMKKCTLESLTGCNVVPWENPSGVCEAILSFSKRI